MFKKFKYWATLRWRWRSLTSSTLPLSASMSFSNLIFDNIALISFRFKEVFYNLVSSFLGIYTVFVNIAVRSFFSIQRILLYRFAQAVAARPEPLSLLINNAGVLPEPVISQCINSTQDLKSLWAVELFCHFRLFSGMGDFGAITWAVGKSHLSDDGLEITTQVGH